MHLVRRSFPPSYCIEKFYLLGYNATLLAVCFMLVSGLAYSLILKKEVTFFSEMSVDFPWTTWHYIPEHRTLHNHCCENLKSHIYNAFTKAGL
jgi:hypothetical protein